MEESDMFAMRPAQEGRKGGGESKISEMRPAQGGKKTAENRGCLKCDQRREEMVEEMV